ncbi:hypothetical protein COCMIDRAFT_65946, partial [Bipolaris oryzae ATCC 44560]
NDAASTDKRKPVRRDQEKRRQQNIKAQKKYRDKLKRRLDQLETLAATVAEGAATTEATTPDAVVIATPAPSSVSSRISSRSITADGQIMCHYLGQSLSSEYSNESTAFSDLDLSASIFSNSPSDLAPCDTVGSIEISNCNLTVDPASRLHPWIDYVECGCVSPHVQASSAVGISGYRDLKALNPDLSPFPVDPVDHTLSVERICIVRAVTANRLHLGITEEMLCHDDAESPFFRPFRNTIGDSGIEGVVKTMQSIFKSLKPDLRPIKEQIVIRHHPIIDLLPFPTLRKNLIAKQDCFYNQELYYDLISGLVCWAGVGRSAENSAPGSASTITPWDGRSWEARTWFLQKYWTELGGEEGELVRQSEWWRRMRGEDT